MLTLSPKQRELQERDNNILRVARELVLAHGYYGVTMDHIAKESGCPKGTLYNRFACKEDILVAIAVDCAVRRSDMIRRAAGFHGRSRERLLGLGEAAALFGRLNPQDLLILHTATGPIREKASISRLSALVEAERTTMTILVNLLDEAIREGDLVPEYEGVRQEVAIGNFSLLEGGFALIQDQVPQHVLGVGDPFHKLWRYFNRTMDAYGWKPLFSEWDYEESLANIRKAVFPDEAQALYGKGEWYGDRK